MPQERQMRGEVRHECRRCCDAVVTSTKTIAMMTIMMNSGGISKMSMSASPSAACALVARVRPHICETIIIRASVGDHYSSDCCI